MAKSARASLAIYEWSTYKEDISGYTNLRFCKSTLQCRFCKKKCGCRPRIFTEVNELFWEGEKLKRRVFALFNTCDALC